MKTTIHKHLLIVALITIASFVQAQLPVYLSGKETIGQNPTLFNCDLVIGPKGELFFGTSLVHLQEINKLYITGNYMGEVGSKVFMSVVDNSNSDGTHGFFDIDGFATGRTEIILDMFDDWNGSIIYLARAHHSGSDSLTFFMEDQIYNGHLAKLKCTTLGNDFVWYIEGHWDEGDCLPIILQKRNNTLVVNNNRSTNGGYNFTYYKWYRNEELVHEGTNGTGIGGIYNTGKNASLNPNDTYHVVVTDQFGDEHHTCAFNPTIFEHITKIIAYPNPAYTDNSDIKIDVETDDEKLLEHGVISVYDMQGRHIGHDVHTNGNRITPIKLPATKGLFVVKFVSGNVVKSVKIAVK